MIYIRGGAYLLRCRWLKIIRLDDYALFIQSSIPEEEEEENLRSWDTRFQQQEGRFTMNCWLG